MEEFLTKLGTAAWNINYHQFLERTGFVDSQYAIDKFMTFQEAVKLINQFDAETLDKLTSN